MSTPNEQQPTPRTDAFQNERHTMNAYRKVLAFARQLERELAELQQINHTLHNLMVSGERRGVEKAAEELATERAAHAASEQTCVELAADLADTTNKLIAERAAREAAEWRIAVLNNEVRALRPPAMPGYYSALEMHKMKVRAESAEHCLRNLLAVVHRDGGHYVSKHGIARATDDAVRVVNDLRAAREAAEAAALQIGDQWRAQLQRAESALKQYDCLQTIAARIVLKHNQCETITDHDFDELEAAHCAMEKI